MIDNGPIDDGPLMALEIKVLGARMLDLANGRLPQHTKCLLCFIHESGDLTVSGLGFSDEQLTTLAVRLANE